MDKKIGLEHTIRNIVQESIGGPNTDKFKGTPKAFLQPAPHIEPKVGDSHPDGSSVAAKRGLAKIRTSETMKEALAPKKGETQADLGYDPAFEMTPEEKSRREAAKTRANKEALKTAKFDPNQPGIYSRDVPPTEKLKNAVTDVLSKSPAYKNIAGQKANDLSTIASSIPFASAIGKAIDSAYYSSKAQPAITGKGAYLAAKGKPTAPDNRTQFEKDVAAYKQKGSEKLATEKGTEAVIDAATQAIAGKAIGALMGTEGGAAVSQAAKDFKPPSFFGKQKTPPTVSTTKVEPPKLVSTRAETPKIEISKTVNKTISDIMKRPDLGDAANINKPKSVETPSVTNVKPEKVEPLPQTGGKGKKPEAETVEPQTQGNLALKPKQSEVPSAPPEKPLKFDKPGQDVVPVEKPTSTKPYKPKTMTPDEIAKEMDKFKRQQAPVTEPPSKKSIDPKEFFGKPAPESIKPPANVNNKTPAPVKSAPAVTPTGAPATKSAPAVSRPAAAPAAAPQTANAPAAAPALAPAAAPALAPAAAPALAPAAQTAAQQAQKKTQEEKGKKEENKKRKLPSLPSFSIPDMTVTDLQGHVPFKTYLHRASDRATFGEAADETRTSIENVARPNSKTRQQSLNKQQQIKQKIIDENAKKVDTIRKAIADKKSSTVILNPKLKHQELDQN